MDIEEVFRAGAPGAGDEARARRIASSALARLARRERRLRAGEAFGFLGVCVAIAALAVTVRDPMAPPVATTVVPSPPRAVESSEARPRPAPTLVRSRSAKKIAPLRPRAPTAAEAASAFWLGCRAAPDPATHLAAALAALPPAARERIRYDVRAAKARHPGTVPALSQAAWWDSFARGLGASQRQEAWPILEAVLDARGPTVAAIEAAGELGDGRSVPRLRRWLALADGRAEAAARALGRIPGRASLLALLASLDATRGITPLVPGLRRELEAALVQRQAELRLALDAGPDERPLVFRALGELRTAASAELLVAALEDPALRPFARQSLIRIARKDLGTRPEGWNAWLSAEVVHWSPLKENT